MDIQGHSLNTDFDLPRISLLAEHLIDQIKAGEVIESPANMAKELIENAIDAKAKKITIKIKNDPLEYFSIADDGHGIHPQDLPLVFARHATSKIHQYQDIYELSSYGFRGEALASLGAIAKVQIKTKTTSDSSYIFTHQFGQSLSIHKTADSNHQSGTEITVTELFANTPARLKFIQNKITELQKFRRIIHSFVLAYPDISWDIHEEQEFFRYPALDIELRKNKLLAQNLTIKEMSYKNTKVTLWIDLHPSKKRNSLHQFIYVNNRLINFSLLHSIIVKHLNCSPSYALFIETLQQNIDVNVHPAKTEVKFFDKSTLLSIISSLLKSEFSLNNAGTLIPQSEVQKSSSASGVTSTDTTANHCFDNEVQATAFENILLLHFHNKVSEVLRTDGILFFLLKQTAEDTQPEEVSILVSQPFHYKLQTIHKKILSSWEPFGLILNIKNDELLQIQSLPKGWIYTHYEILIQYLLDNTLTPHNLNQSVISKNFNPNMINLTSLINLLDFLNRDKLKKYNVLKSLNEIFTYE
jgi:DNA mismatch repair protein MutL